MFAVETVLVWGNVHNWSRFQDRIDQTEHGFRLAGFGQDMRHAALLGRVVLSELSDSVPAHPPAALKTDCERAQN